MTKYLSYLSKWDIPGVTRHLLECICTQNLQSFFLLKFNEFKFKTQNKNMYGK